jgi:ornithine racemase
MNRVTIDLEGLEHNLRVVNRWMEGHGASWTLVTKVLCGHTDTIKALQHLGVKSMADSRLANLRAIDRVYSDFESWYLRPPHLTAVPSIVALADVSLNSELEIIRTINEEAGKQGRVHRIIIMIELGDLREGILPGSLVNFYGQIFELDHIEMLGIGANLGCLSGAVPNVDQLMQLVLYRELLELKFGKPLPIISAGSSAVLPLLLEGRVPKAINHFRIGEALFLGTDLVNGDHLQGLRTAVTLSAEIAEIKEKNLVPMGETTSMTPFEVLDNGDTHPGQRGYRAIVTVGQLDTEVRGLNPTNPDYEIVGASSDVSVVNVGENPDDLKVGDTLEFRVNYAAMLRLMNNQYIDRVVFPRVEAYVPLSHTDQPAAA